MPRVSPAPAAPPEPRDSELGPLRAAGVLAEYRRIRARALGTESSNENSNARSDGGVSLPTVAGGSPKGGGAEHGGDRDL
jgi:hypothetical protein